MGNLSQEDIQNIKNSILEEIIGFDPFEINKHDIENIDKEIEEVETYIKRLNDIGIYTNWQKKDLAFNENLLKELLKFKEEYK